MAVKKSKTAKKTTAPRKKTTVKKEEPIVKVEELDKVLDTMNGDPSVLTPIDEEILIAPSSEGNSWSDPKVYEAKVDFVDQDPPLEKELETMNGDPTVVTPVDEIQEEALAETFKENKINKRMDNFIGYSWNGMEMDTY